MQFQRPRTLSTRTRAILIFSWFVLLNSAKKQLVPVPFIPSNPSLKSSGSGAYYGTFGHYKNMKTTDGQYCMLGSLAYLH
jgi:hypothetical protein